MNWLSSTELCQKLGVTRPTLYKMARKHAWDTRKVRMEHGGNRKQYAVPDEFFCNRVTVVPKPVVRETPVDYPVEKEHDDIPDLRPKTELTLVQQKQAELRARLCELIIENLEQADKRTVAWKSLTASYNAGELLPELFKLEGKHGERTLRRWVKEYQETGKNTSVLVRSVKGGLPERGVTEMEKNFLLHLLLSPNRVSIGTAIRKLKQMAALEKIESAGSVITLRRWCEEWRDSHRPEWNLLRNGKKSLRETGIKSILRGGDLQVGDVWVADGHKLAFDILDPVTGKPRRMMMIMFYDWASRYPVGASLAISEDSQHILLALRNGILNWGARPKYVYLDNGKAFRSKLFNLKWEDHDLEQELAGIFPRLGIGVVFANAYNARAKVIERFFLTFQNDFERFMSTFRGGSIADKPATLKRNEKWMKSLFEGKPLTIPQAKAMIGLYLEKMYGLTPHAGIGGDRPFEVFQEADVPDERKIDPSDLNFLMLSNGQRIVQPSGIRFNSIHFWDDALIHHVKEPITLRYDPMDMRSILVYDTKGRFICQARARRHQHPFIHLSSDKPQAQKELQKELKSIRRLEKTVKESSQAILMKVNNAVGQIQQPVADQIGGMFADQPLIEQSQATMTVDDLVKASAESEEIREEQPPRGDEELNFEELMKAIGIG